MFSHTFSQCNFTYTHIFICSLQMFSYYPETIYGELIKSEMDLSWCTEDYNRFTGLLSRSEACRGYPHSPAFPGSLPELLQLRESTARYTVPDSACTAKWLRRASALPFVCGSAHRARWYSEIRISTCHRSLKHTSQS